jgi:hypothetical protein
MALRVIRGNQGASAHADWRSFANPAPHAERQTGQSLTLFTRNDSDWRLVHTTVVPFGAVGDLKSELSQILVLMNRMVQRADGTQLLLSIPPRNSAGFDVGLQANETGINGTFGGLEQVFSNLEEAMCWVERALSDVYRLKITLAGDWPCGWQLEPVGGPRHDAPVLATGQLSLRSLFHTKHSIYRRNVAPPSAVQI